MDIRSTQTRDWKLLKQVRLAALLDAPTAFGVSYPSAAAYTEEQWQERASSAGTEFWLAFEQDRPVGMIGAAVSDSQRFNLIGMWVEPAARGSVAATRLVDAVKARATQRGFDRVFLDVSPDNARAANFYLKQGFEFLDEWEPLESHPHISVQTMCWVCQEAKALALKVH
ncbi:GNAT family N-acetyltransferase [Pseudomonas sp. NPDC087817]|uniref:GNAT family N-acetyltransferase n=1 Tax=Pseudomonas sp. NPDC087817 TaxID=3364451 RepID=UPI003817821B